MTKGDWVQLLVGTVILGSLAFLGTNVFEMKGLLSSIQERSQATESRVSRIADVLPGIGVRIASEEVYKSIRGFMAVGSSSEGAAGQWLTRVALYDRKGQTLKVFEVESSEDMQEATRYYLMGIARSHRRNEITFADLKQYSIDLNNHVVVPPSIDINTSLVFNDMEPEEMEAHLRNLRAEEIENIRFGAVENWSSLTERFLELEAAAEFAE